MLMKKHLPFQVLMKGHLPFKMLMKEYLPFKMDIVIIFCEKQGLMCYTGFVIHITIQDVELK